MSYTHEWYEKNKESLNKSSRDYYKRKRLDRIKAELSMIERVRTSTEYAGLPLNQLRHILIHYLTKELKNLQTFML